MHDPELTSDHIDPEILAACADPRTPEVVVGSVQAHLVRCARCLSLYAEFGRAHLAEGLEQATLVPIELMEAARAIPAGQLQIAAVAPPRQGRWSPWAAAACAAAALVACLLLWNRTQPPGAARVPVDLQRAIALELAEDSFGKLLYAGDLAPRARRTRGTEASGEDLDLTELKRAFDPAPPSPEVAYWLVAGLLATRSWEADPYLQSALERFPSDARLHNLAGIQAYKQSHLETAQNELRHALQIRRDPAYLVNLGRILDESGRAGEAEVLWREVLAQHPGTVSATVAAGLLRHDP